MSSPGIPVVSVKGAPFECGEKYGAQVSALIRKNLSQYLDRWKLSWGASPADIMARARPFGPVIGNFDAGILEYLQGIAKGADMTIEEIIALNARYEISFANPLLKAPPEGCTALAAMPGATRNGHTLLGQNWDLYPVYSGARVVTEVAMTGKPAFVTVCEAGVIAHRGMNAAGVGLCFNALVSSLDKFEPRPPFQVIMCAMLQTDSLGLAMRKVLNAGTVASGNILTAHRDGEAFDLEVSPRNVAIFYPEGGLLNHTNNFLDYTERHGLVDMLRMQLPDTVVRYHRSRRLLEEARGHVTVETFQNIFKDHFNYPNSICRHPDTREKTLDQIATMSSTIIDLTEGTFYIADDNPCIATYVPYTPAILKSV